MSLQEIEMRFMWEGYAGMFAGGMVDEIPGEIGIFAMCVFAVMMVAVFSVAAHDTNRFFGRDRSHTLLSSKDRGNNRPCACRGSRLQNRWQNYRDLLCSEH